MNGTATLTVGANYPEHRVLVLDAIARRKGYDHRSDAIIEALDQYLEREHPRLLEAA